MAQTKKKHSKPKDKRKRPSHLVSAKRRRIRGIESRIDDLILNGEKWRTAVNDPLDARLERTIEAASTVTIDLNDPEMKLLRSPLLEERIDVKLDGLHFRLAHVGKTDTLLAMTFEARVVSRMRAVKGTRKAYRDKTTRAEFILSQVREVKRERIPVYIPKLHKERPIESGKDARKSEIDMDDKRGKGLDMDADLTVKGEKANASQLKNADLSLRVAESHGAPRAAMIALIAAEIVESLIQNLTFGDSSSVGILQLLDIHGSVEKRRDVAWVVTQFLTKGFTGRGGAIALAEQGMSSSAIAQAVQGAADPVYSQYIGEATKFVDAFGGGGIGGKSGTITQSETKRYAFERKKKEDAWDCTGRLAEEVQFRRFESAGVFYYVSEEQLFDARPWVYLDGDPEGIESVNFEWDANQPVQEVLINGRAKDWAAPPGTVVKLNKDYGPAEGRYLVSTISSSLFSDSFEATLKKPMKELPEPAPETEEKTTSFGESGKFGGSSAGDGSLEGVNITSTAPGPPHWGGAGDVFRQFVHPFMKKEGLSPGGQKETGHATGGDHDPNSTTSYATDYGTFNGEGIARKLAKALGNRSWEPNSYATFNVRIDGHTFRVQILWGSGIDHGDHVHVGMRLA